MSNKLSSAAYEIHPEHTIIREQDGRSVEFQHPPWIKLSVAFREGLLRQMRGPQLSVFLSVALHMNTEFKSWPGIRLIAKETGYSPKTVIDAVRKLEADGILSVERHDFVPGKGRKSNTYTVEALASYGVETPTEEPYVVVTETQSPETQQTTTEVEPYKEEPTKEEPSIYIRLKEKNVFPSIAKKLSKTVARKDLEAALASGLSGGELVALIRGEYIEPENDTRSARDRYAQGQFRDFWDS